MFSRASVQSTLTAQSWEFLGVWGGEVNIVAESPTQAGVILAGIGSGSVMLGGLYRSTDQGVTWQTVNHQDLARVPVEAIAFAPDGTAYVGTAWHLWKSVDDGRTWVQHVLPSRRYWARSVVVDPKVPSTIWVGAGSQVLKSLDGADSWVERTPPDAYGTCYSIAIDPTNTNQVFVGFSDSLVSNSRLYFSSDGGESWHDRSNGLPDNPILDIAHDGDRVLVGGGVVWGQ